MLTFTNLFDEDLNIIFILILLSIVNLYIVKERCEIK